MIEIESAKSYKTNSPPSNLTLALLYLENAYPKAVEEILNQIAERLVDLNLWETSLIETLTVFNYSSKCLDLTPYTLRYLYTDNWQKFCGLFGHKSKQQIIASILISYDASTIAPLNGNLLKIFPLLAVTYCASNKHFRSFVLTLSTLESIDRLVSREFISELKSKSRVLCANNDIIKSNTECAPPGIKILARPRIAVCISGQLRGFRHCHSTIDNLGLSGYSHDIFVSSWTRVGGRIPSFDQASRIFPFRFAKAFCETLLTIGEQEFYARYPSLKRLIESDEDVSVAELKMHYRTSSVDLEDDRSKPFSDYSSIAKMHYKLYRCFSLIKDARKNYDMIIRIRPDLLIPSNLSLDWDDLYYRSLEDKTVFADFGTYISPKVISWNFGHIIPLMIGDLFAAGAISWMDKYMNSFSENFNLCNKDIISLPRGFMPHTTLSRILMYHGISVENFPACSLGAKDLIEHRAITSSEIKQALKTDIERRAMDAADYALFASVDCPHPF
jgi:hypothetical protein